MSQHLEFVVPARKEEANVARLCRRFGISRKTGYKWLRRFEASREEGLLDQSCRPRHSLAQIARAVEEAILQVRAVYSRFAWASAPAPTNAARPSINSRGRRD